jgi:hypothetical protein
MTSSSPASLVSMPAGKAPKSIGAAAGSAVSRPAVPGEVLCSGCGPRQAGADLIHRQAFPAQFDHPAAGAVFLRGALAAGFARLGEQDQLARAEVADQRGQR